MTKDAIFRLYSMTKPFTSVATMMLVEEGRILLNDPVYGVFTSHNGVKEAYAKEGVDWYGMTGAEQIDRLAKVPLAHQPGSAWEYSLSTDVLGRVVEAVTGRTLGEFFQERIFAPLKMTDTAFLIPGATSASPARRWCAATAGLRGTQGNRPQLGKRLARRIPLGRGGRHRVLDRPQGTDGDRVDDPRPAGTTPERRPRPLQEPRAGGAAGLSVRRRL